MTQTQVKAPTVVTYGPSKRGKTTDLLYTVPEALYLVPAQGNLEAWSVLTGVRPREVQVGNFDAAIGKLRELSKLHPSRRPSAVVIDDLSILAERTDLALDPNGRGGWEKWGALQRKLLQMRDLCIDNNIAWFANAHERQPNTDTKGVFHQGGPKLPSKGMTADFPHVAQLVLRVGHDSLVSEHEWPGLYLCDPTDNRWIMGDRYTVVPREAPMNLREILRRAAEVRPAGDRPQVPARARGLEWLDAAAEGIARGLATGAFPNAVEAAKAMPHIPQFQGKDPRHLRWAWRDGVARYKLRAKSNLFDLFTLPSNGVAGTPRVG